MPSIMIDGYNLGLEKGTGVATYARNLSIEAHHLGMDVSVLYGNRSSASRDPLLREITFFDESEKRRGGVLEVLEQSHHALRGPLGHKIDGRYGPYRRCLACDGTTSARYYS